MTVDISIVGCGPVGATLANLLADFGHSIAIIEKETEIYRAPRAVHIDDEVIRIFQAIGILKELQDSITPFKKMQFVSASGKVLMETGMPENYEPYGHAPSNWFLQPILEQQLRATFQPKKQVHWFEGYEVIEVEDTPKTASLKAINLQNQEPISIQSKYLIGCDGGRSMVRKSMGGAFENLNFDQPWMVVDTFLKSPKDVALLPALHQQICDPKRPITYVPGVGTHRRFEFMLVDGDTKESIVQKATIKKLIAPFIDPDKLTIARSAVYTFHGLTVAQWRKGRLILAGDSAHQMPPFAGQGMCSGIRDAHNLAFKLDLVLKKKATEKLLNTYQTERKPHVTAISKGAIKMGKAIQTQHPILASLRNVLFLLARNSAFLQEKIRADFVKKLPYENGFLGKHHALSGQLAIQPSVQIGNEQLLLDELLGNQFVLISTKEIPSVLATHFKNQLNGQVFLIKKDFMSSKFEEWMQIHKMEFVIIRPDRYIFDAGRLKDLEKVLSESMRYEV